jgi:hypothetical protein
MVGSGQLRACATSGQPTIFINDLINNNNSINGYLPRSAL